MAIMVDKAQLADALKRHGMEPLMVKDVLEIIEDECEEVEAEPVCHGMWIESEDAYDIECSACGEKQGYITRYRPAFCDFCGSKMDLEVKT